MNKVYLWLLSVGESSGGELLCPLLDAANQRLLKTSKLIQFQMTLLMLHPEYLLNLVTFLQVNSHLGGVIAISVLVNQFDEIQFIYFSFVVVILVSYLGISIPKAKFRKIYPYFFFQELYSLSLHILGFDQFCITICI